MDAAALSFELFAICVKVYQLLLEASDVPRSLRYLQVRLRMERDKLVDWGVLADLSEDERTLSPGLQLHKHVVHDTLQEIKLVLVELTKLSDRHTTETVVGEAAERAVDENAEVTSSHSSVQLQKKAVP